MGVVTRTELEELDAGVKSLYRIHTLAGLCKDLSLDLTRELSKRYNVDATVTLFEIGENRDPHYAVVVQRKALHDEFFTEQYSDSCDVIIDPTIKQFSHENVETSIVTTGVANHSELPDIGVYPPGAPERAWYHEANQTTTEATTVTV